jgi:hypothetical protein
MRTAVAAAVLTLVLAPAASAQTLPDLRPPDAFLSSPSSDEVKADIQAYCWQEPDASGGFNSLCADRFDAIDPAQAVVVTQGDLLTLRFDRPIRPRSVTVSRVETSVSPPIETFEVPADNPTRFRADLPPGTHILRVFTTWEQGDAIYIFEVTVRPPAPGPGFLPPEVLDALARISEAVGGRLEEQLSEVLASTELLIATLQDLFSRLLPVPPPA